MLTEGWDTNTVTHILGVRAFGTQLLCEQVVGRALRRQSYDLNAEGLFDCEYADIIGIPFDFAAQPVVTKPKPPKPTTRVQALPERADSGDHLPPCGRLPRQPAGRAGRGAVHREFPPGADAGRCRAMPRAAGGHCRRGRRADDGGARCRAAERDQLSPRQASSLQPVPRSGGAAKDAPVRADQAGGQALD